LNELKKNLTILNSFYRRYGLTQLKQLKQQKGAVTLVARRHNVKVLLSNRTFLIFAVLVV